MLTKWRKRLTSEILKDINRMIVNHQGKAKEFIELGTKIELNVVNEYSFLETTSWDAYHEGNGLKEAIERYSEEYGCYPEAVLADRNYRTRKNLRFCKEQNIRLSEPQDNRERNAIEGKVGEGKRSYGLDLIMARLPDTSGNVIAIQVLVINLKVQSVGGIEKWGGRK